MRKVQMFSWVSHLEKPIAMNIAWILNGDIGSFMEVRNHMCTTNTTKLVDIQIMFHKFGRVTVSVFKVLYNICTQHSVLVYVMSKLIV